jgi:cytidyltransferase-like protein
MPKPYHRIGLGGTFDHFHVGHKAFLDFAGQLADQLVVGVTEPTLISHKTALEQIEPYKQRAQGVREFLYYLGVSFEVVPLTDPFGPTLKDSTIDAIAVTEETVAGARAINQRRGQIGMPSLPVHVCRLVRDSNGDLISSTRIRLGEVSRDGEVYLGLFRGDKVLTPAQGLFFKAAQGPIVSDFSSLGKESPIITVGDIVTDTFLQHGWPFNLAIYDQRTLRKSYTSQEISPIVHASAQRVVNPAGSMSFELAQWLTLYFRSFYGDAIDKAQSEFLFIEGEEDLATVAAVVLAPLGSTIVYGQPHEGMVQLVVTEALKSHFIRGISA